MTLYFFGIGLGYILMQISLLQRLMIVLGRPTLALSVVLFSTLLGTGWSHAAERLFPSGNLRRAMLAGRRRVGRTGSLLRRADAGAHVFDHAGSLRSSALILFATGTSSAAHFLLESARSHRPENGRSRKCGRSARASIAASVLAAVIGLIWGSGSVLSAGILAYVLALVTAVVSARLDPPVPFCVRSRLPEWQLSPRSRSLTA